MSIITKITVTTTGSDVDTYEDANWSYKVRDENSALQLTAEREPTDDERAMRVEYNRTQTIINKVSIGDPVMSRSVCYSAHEWAKVDLEVVSS